MPARVQVAPEILDGWPHYRAVVLIAEGVVNGPSDERSEDLLAGAERSVGESGVARAADDPRIAAWRTAFSEFGAKPSRYPSSAESLLARLLKGEALPRINALVDTYNAVSLRHAIPIGGEDLDALEGDLRLVRAAGTEDFDGGEPPRPGEVVWRDDVGVTCRRWNWRQGRRTQLDDETTTALFILDALHPMSDHALRDAADDLITQLTLLGSDIRVTRRMIAARAASEGGA